MTSEIPHFYSLWGDKCQPWFQPWQWQALQGIPSEILIHSGSFIIVGIFETLIITTSALQKNPKNFREFSQKFLHFLTFDINLPYHFPPKGIIGLLVRMDAELMAAVTGYAEKLCVIMAYHFSVSVWMRQNTISATCSSMLVSQIMGQSMGT